MPDDSLIVPTLLPTGSLHFAAVKVDSVVQDVLNALTNLEEVQEDVLGDWRCDRWAIQKIKKETPGRQWDERELERLSNGKQLSLFIYCFCAKFKVNLGILSALAPVQPLLDPPTARQQMHRHFSSFPLTSHLHTPYLRLVSLHPHLTLSITFLRVPEVHDGFQWSVFIARSTTVADVLDAVSDELGLTKVLEGPGGGNVDYIMEEVRREGVAEGTCGSLPFRRTSILKVAQSPRVSGRTKLFQNFSPQEVLCQDLRH